MLENIEVLVERYRKKGLLVDSNLLLLFFVGSYDLRLIGSHFTRLKQFAKEDFHTLASFIDIFELVWTTPNILTEVSNLANKLSKQQRENFFQVFAQLTPALQEEYCHSEDICALPFFHWFGLTDSAIAAMAAGKYLVLTDDLKLANHLATQGTDVINFNHIRTLNWR